MPTDVGIRLSVDGEKQFSNALNGVNSQIKALGAEMKATVAALTETGDAEKATAARTDILTRSVQAAEDKVALLTSQYEKQKNRLNQLGSELDDVIKTYGKNSKEAEKSENAYNRQVTALNKLSTQLSNAEADASRFRTELKNVGNATDDVADKIEQAADSTSGFGDILSGNLAADVITNGIQTIVSGISDLIESTQEYRKIMGTLETSSRRAGYTTAETEEAFNKLYGVLGDEQAAATTVANLQAMKLEQDQLMKAVDATIGAWSTYGDSIPIDGLAEAINETSKVGTVTGVLADALNWAGISEDEFNDKLAEATTNTERANLILHELGTVGLVEAAEGWRQNNESIVATNEAQNNFNEATARLAEIFAPVAATIKNGLADIVNGFADLIEEGGATIPIIAGLGTVFAGLGLVGLISKLGGVVGIMSKLKTGIMAVNAVLAANPIGLVVTLIAGLVAALVTAYKTNEDFRNKVNEVWESVKEKINGVTVFIYELVNTKIPEMINFIKEHIDILIEKILGAIDWLMGLPEELKDIGIDLVKGLWSGIQEKAEWLMEKIRGVVKKIKKLFEGVKGFDVHSPSKWAKGVAGNVIKGFGNEFATNNYAYRMVKDSIAGMKNVMSSINGSANAVMATSAGGVNNSRSYSYGDIVLNIANVNNGNGRDVETLATELEFFRKQQGTGRGY